MRTKREKKWTRDFTIAEQNDRNNRRLYPEIPSPMGRNWLLYIHHRLKMLRKGMAVYTTTKYTRLQFDKYIESNRASDRTAAMLTGGHPSLIHLGNAEIAANSPISIKKHMRCPGTRKLIRSFNKLGIFQCFIYF